MASTLTGATETVVLSESYTQNGSAKNSENSYVVNDISFDDVRTMRVPSAGEISIIDFASAGLAIGPGKFNGAETIYVRIVNKDDENFVRIGMVDSGSGEEFYMKVGPGQILLFPTVAFSANSAGGGFAAFVEATTITAQADTGDVDIEYRIFQTTPTP